MDVKIRNESSRDIELIHRVIELAFREAPYTDHTEQFIVRALRRAGALFLSQVAELDGEILGHLAISPVNISDDSTSWYGLGPISVLPAHQGEGVGSKLVEKALADLKEQGAAGCVVLGDPNYYGRFGFKVVEGLVLPGVPAEYFQALSFNRNFPQGEVAYHEAFSTQG
ncbi:GNAT family N-acetyltransferase [Microbulbifer sp. JMSA004]|uniref:GNAT family N-acetyltransferase n=1 Tax=unclassified Microbulbifer TaxID=2619833 RepID=UPI0024AE45F7|nr:N-acetyltransferase [Microbulbifer sp. VAAF005]WHI46915.1 N-acetyltransferase [Microbulbifer sp. VAAF005]